MVIEESLLMTFWAFDELKEIIADEEFTAIDTNGWSVTGICKVEFTPAGNKGRDKTTLAFCLEDGTH